MKLKTFAIGAVTVIGFLAFAVLMGNLQKWYYTDIVRSAVVGPKQVEESKINLQGSACQIVGKLVRKEAGRYYRYLVVKSDVAQSVVLVEDMVFESAKVGGKAYVEKGTVTACIED